MKHRFRMPIFVSFGLMLLRVLNKSWPAIFTVWLIAWNPCHITWVLFANISSYVKCKLWAVTKTNSSLLFSYVVAGKAENCLKLILSIFKKLVALIWIIQTAIRLLRTIYLYRLFSKSFFVFEHFPVASIYFAFAHFCSSYIMKVDKSYLILS